jgi:hypothetical protein
VTWTVLDRLITAKAPMFALSWVADIPDPDTRSFEPCSIRPAERNCFRYSGRDQVDSLLDVARAAENPTLRQTAYERAGADPSRGAAFVPLHNPASFIGLRDDIVGLGGTAIGNLDAGHGEARFAGDQAR